VFRRESNAHSGKVSAEAPPCGADAMCCVVPFQARQVNEETLPLDDPTQGGKPEATKHDVGAHGGKPEDTITEEQPISNVHPVELSSDQAHVDTAPSCKAEESTVEPKDQTAELPGGGASILYCVLPDRSCHSVASTSSRQDHHSVDGELYCVLPPRNGRPGRSSGRSNRSFGIKGLLRRSSSFSNDIHLNSETSSPIKKDGAFPVAATTERTPSTLPTEAEDSPKGTTQDAETLRSDRCHLPRRIFSHRRSSSFEWAKMSMVQWAMRLPNRYTSVHPDSKSVKSDASPRLNCDSETEGTSAPQPESMFSFAVYDVVWPPSELEPLREKCSSVCRLFSHEELKLATANYSPGNSFAFHVSITWTEMHLVTLVITWFLLW
jgi:hypothetical protein